MTTAAPKTLVFDTPAGSVPIRCFTNEAVPVEAEARRQLETLAARPELRQYVAVLPDVHAKPRNPTPTGTVAVTADTIIPRAVDGGVNCGLRFMATSVPARELGPAVLDDLYGKLLDRLPLKRHDTPLLGPAETADVLTHGLERMVRHLGLPEDELTATEHGGRAMPHVAADEIRAQIPDKALRKDAATLGTVGAGNHFLELQEITEVLDPRAAADFGLAEGEAVFMLHSDSRRAGKKIVKPLLQEAVGADADPGDPRLWSVPAESDLGRRLVAALTAAMHAGYANRAAVTHILRGALREALGDERLNLRLVVDCSHESIQLEEHHGERLWVHRHGASRVEPGRPVPVAGCMGGESYLCRAEPAVRDSFCSVAHGAGRVIEKARAAEVFDPSDIEEQMRRLGIRLYRYHADNIAGQAPASFKDVRAVIDAMTAAQLVRPVARLRPVAVLKG